LLTINAAQNTGDTGVQLTNYKSSKLNATLSNAMRGSTAPLVRRVSRQTGLPPARLPIAHEHSFCSDKQTHNISITLTG